jgi:Fe-S-cluster containining protein
MAKHKLPLIVDRVVSDIHAIRLEASAQFEQKVRSAVHEAGIALTCRKGCSNCCHHPFLISIVEGLLVYRWLAKGGKWTPSLRKRLEETRDRTMGLTYEVWMLGNIPCPLLSEENLCSAYEARPLNCRMTYAVTEASLCHPHRIGADTRVVPRSEAVEDFNTNERQTLRRQGFRSLYVPISEAILLGSRIANGQITLEEVEHEFAKDSERARS